MSLKLLYNWSLKTQTRQKKFLDKHLELTSYGELRKVRRVIRACSISEVMRLKNRSRKDLNSLFNHVRIELVATMMDELLINGSLVESIIESSLRKKKLIYPLPQRWIEIFNTNGIPVNKFICLTYFVVYRFKNLLKNYYKVTHIAVRKFDKNCNIKTNSVLIFVNFSSSMNYTAPFSGFDFFNWLQDKKLINRNLQSIYSICSKKSKLHNEITSSQLFKFNMIATIVTCFKLLIKYRYQFVKLFFIAPNLFINYINLNEEIFLNISKFIIPSSHRWIKTSWHLRIEELGTEIMFVNLSDSSEPSKTFDQDLPINWYPFSQWKNISSCSNWQKSIIESQNALIPTPRIEVLGVPDWQDAGNLFINNKNKYVSVFDFEPHIGHYGYTCLNDSGYTDIRNILMFIESIAEMAEKLKIQFIYKSKRVIDMSRRHKTYINSLHRISSSNQYFSVVDEAIAARRIILNSSASIHMPFSSTALIARESNVPTCFYDSVGLIESNDPGANGIEIINDVKVLSQWLIEQIDLKTDTL